MRAKALILVAALLLAVLTLACGGGGGANPTQSAATSTGGPTASAATTSFPTTSGAPIKIVATLPVSGPYAVYGQVQQQMAEMAIDDWNAHGGVLGRPVQLIVENDAGDPQKGVTNIERDINSDHIDAVIPFFNAIPAGPVMLQYKVLGTGWDNNAILNPPDYPYLFNALDLSSTTAQAMLNYITQTLKVKKIGLLYGTTAFPQAFAKAFQAEAANYNVQIVDVENMSDGQVDVTPQLIKLRDAQPDVLVLEGPLPDDAAMLKGRTQIGWAVPVIGGNGFGAGDLVTLVGQDNLQGVSVIEYKNGGVVGSDGTVSQAMQAFLNKVKAKIGGEPVLPLYNYAAAYDAVQMIKVAFDGAGSTDAEAARRYLENLESHPPSPYPFVLQRMNFTPDRHFPENIDALAIAKAGPLVDGELTGFISNIPPTPPTPTPAH
jgi:branched-chain amino acid transport system substrate-binding protein